MYEEIYHPALAIRPFVLLAFSPRQKRNPISCYGSGKRRRRN